MLISLFINVVKGVRVTGSKSSFFAIYVAKVAVKNCSGKLQFCMVLGQKHSLGQKVVPDVMRSTDPQVLRIFTSTVHWGTGTR